MRLIDADVLEQKIAGMQGKTKTGDYVVLAINKFISEGLARARLMLLETPTVEAVEVVHCKECVHWLPDGDHGAKVCDLHVWMSQGHEYCSLGERIDSE